MDLHAKAKHLMRTYEISPKRRFGQNFMVNNHLNLMSSYAAVSNSDIVLEVGAGLGFLTRLLAHKAKKVIAVEADLRLVNVLQDELKDLENVQVVEGNVLEANIPFFNKVVSNLPFSISSPFLYWLFSKSFECAVLTFQKEFAMRLNAPRGSESYGRLTVYTAYHAAVELLDSVPKEAFYPPSSVDAVIVKLKPRKLPPFKVRDKKLFDKTVRILFTQRNRKVRNAVQLLRGKHGLKGAGSKQEIRQLSFDHKRVRQLTPEEFGALANELAQ